MRLREGKQWRPAKVLKPTPEPRSYLEEADNSTGEIEGSSSKRKTTPLHVQRGKERTQIKERRHTSRKPKPKKD